MKENELYGIPPSGAVPEDRRPYIQLAERLGAALDHTMSHAQLLDLRAELLVILIQHRHEHAPPRYRTCCFDC